MAPSRSVALIPARSGSKRVPHKNIRNLAGHPALAYSIRSAIDSGVFERVIVSTDSELYAAVARHYGAEVPFLRPAEYSGDTSPDIEWIRYTLQRLTDEGGAYEVFSILRPTSPFRKAETIRRAFAAFCAAEGVDSLRAVEKVEQHPGKMWVIRGDRLLPLMPLTPEDLPWHSQQYASLPTVYVQNASLEIAWTRTALEKGTIAGAVMLPFLTQGDEGLDINNEKDWWYATHLLARGEAALPPVNGPAFPLDPRVFRPA
jgi:CMP-N-acetylneuraminic acid synthetase